MGRVDLRYDHDWRRFVASVGLAVGDSAAPPSGAQGPRIGAEMVVDCGSNVTMISEPLAVELGFRLDSLETREVGGVTGVARWPIVRNLEIFLIGGPAPSVRLPVAFIVPPDVRRGRGGFAPASWKASVRGAALSILGMDVARALRASLVLDYRALAGRLEW